MHTSAKYPSPSSSHHPIPPEYHRLTVGPLSHPVDKHRRRPHLLIHLRGGRSAGLRIITQLVRDGSFAQRIRMHDVPGGRSGPVSRRGCRSLATKPVAADRPSLVFVLRENQKRGLRRRRRRDEVVIGSVSHSSGRPDGHPREKVREGVACARNETQSRGGCNNVTSTMRDHKITDSKRIASRAGRQNIYAAGNPTSPLHFLSGVVAFVPSPSPRILTSVSDRR